MKNPLPLSDLDVEAHLQAAFQPIKPSNNFVSSVQKRLNLAPAMEISRRMQSPNELLVIFGSVLSALFVLVTVGRALYYLTGRSTGR